MEQEPRFLQSSEFDIRNDMHQLSERILQNKDIRKKIIELAPKGVPEEDQTVDIRITDFSSEDAPIAGHSVKYLGERQPTNFVSRFFLTNRYQYSSILFQERKNGSFILKYMMTTTFSELIQQKIRKSLKILEKNSKRP